MFPTLLTAISVFMLAFFFAPSVDIDEIREPVIGKKKIENMSNCELFQLLLMKYSSTYILTIT